MLTGLLVGHGSCTMGHGSLSAWVTGSWVNASDPLPALIIIIIIIIIIIMVEMTVTPRPNH